ncbi:MAG: 2-oxoacid:acceptor oxidoreductase family protein [Candidatus Aenigmarchaeota archaeon]|nr:2-oxoacid:acceptor oxidoreductase family protein [Candidatus Aenigmarchaeota archaeon]
MIIISVHGRAGQGVESAINVIANSLLSANLNVQTLYFPSDEKRGSHVYGIIKSDKNPIQSRQIEQSDIMLIFDTTLHVKELLAGTKEKSIVIFNSKDKQVYSEIKKKRIKSYALDATGISIAAGAKTMPNIPMLGALAKNFNTVNMKSMKVGVEAFAKDGGLLIEEGYKNVKLVK